METNETANTVFTPLADDAFLSLGTQQIAYIKAVDLPDLSLIHISEPTRP